MKWNARRPWLLVLALATPIVAVAQREDVTVVIHAVSGPVHYLEGQGGNIGLSIGNDGVLMVDDQFARLSDKINAAIAGVTDKKIRFVLNTHWHGDHTGGNEVFGKIAPIIAHANVRERLEGGMKGAPGGREVPPAPKEALPVVTFDESLSVHFNGEEIRAIHVPHGHTDGDVIVYFTGSNVVHMGDQFFNGMFPYIDGTSGGSVAGYIRNVRTVLDELKPGAKIIPGHGALATAEDLERFHEMLTGTAGAVKAALERGETLEQMREKKILSQWEEWATGFIGTDRFLEMLYGDLAGPTGTREQ